VVGWDFERYHISHAFLPLIDGQAGRQDRICPDGRSTAGDEGKKEKTKLVPIDRPCGLRSVCRVVCFPVFHCNALCFSDDEGCLYEQKPPGVFGVIFFSFFFWFAFTEMETCFWGSHRCLGVYCWRKKQEQGGDKEEEGVAGRGGGGRLMMRDEVDGRPAGPWQGVAGCSFWLGVGAGTNPGGSQVPTAFQKPWRCAVADFGRSAKHRRRRSRREGVPGQGGDWDAGWPGLRIWWILESGGHAAGAGDVIMRAVQGQQVGLGGAEPRRSTAAPTECARHRRPAGQSDVHRHPVRCVSATATDPFFLPFG
jgi:hypothetical protein